MNTDYLRIEALPSAAEMVEHLSEFLRLPPHFTSTAGARLTCGKIYRYPPQVLVLRL
jgi:hypothetical protein